MAFTVPLKCDAAPTQQPNQSIGSAVSQFHFVCPAANVRGGFGCVVSHDSDISPSCLMVSLSTTQVFRRSDAINGTEFTSMPILK